MKTGTALYRLPDAEAVKGKPEAGQGKGAMQQMVHFHVPSKVSLPVCFWSSAVQGDCAT